MSAIFPLIAAPNDDAALIFDGAEVSFRALAWYLRRFNNDVDVLGIGPGEHAAVFAQGHLGTVVGALGCVYGEIRCTLLDPGLDEAEVARAMELTGATHRLAAAPASLSLAGVHKIPIDEPRRLHRMQKLELAGDRVDDSEALTFVAGRGDAMEARTITRAELATAEPTAWPDLDAARALAQVAAGLRGPSVVRIEGGEHLRVSEV